jgi:uncharacterized phage infection (PIP) family protein YhgE
MANPVETAQNKKNVSITRSKYDTLKENSNKYEKLVEETEILEDEIDNLKGTVEELDKDKQAMVDENTALKQDKLQLKQDKLQLQADVDRLTKHSEEIMKALKDSGKFSKCEQSIGVKKAIHAWNRLVGYRTVKFPREKSLTKHVNHVYDAIKENMGFDVEEEDTFLERKEFHRIYESIIAKNMGSRRQYDQTGGQRACCGK